MVALNCETACFMKLLTVGCSALMIMGSLSRLGKDLTPKKSDSVYILNVIFSFLKIYGAFASIFAVLLIMAELKLNFLLKKF